MLKKFIEDEDGDIKPHGISQQTKTEYMAVFIFAGLRSVYRRPTLMVEFKIKSE